MNTLTKLKTEKQLERENRSWEKKKQRSDKARPDFVNWMVSKNKFLSNPIHHKNNYWSWAAWDSWAAQGSAGSCGCGIGHYNANLKNTRAKTERGGKNSKWSHDVSSHLCSECVSLIEKLLNVNFKRH